MNLECPLVASAGDGAWLTSEGPIVVGLETSTEIPVGAEEESVEMFNAAAMEVGPMGTEGSVDTSLKCVF